jgi:hypothetical protein
MQAIIKQQEQQLMNGKKERDQLCFIVDERSNELRNFKQKNEQLEQMIRNGKQYNNINPNEDTLTYHKIDILFFLF